jgi:hypothetical protein
MLMIDLLLYLSLHHNLADNEKTEKAAVARQPICLSFGPLFGFCTQFATEKKLCLASPGCRHYSTRHLHLAHTQAIISHSQYIDAWTSGSSLLGTVSIGPTQYSR